MKRIVLIAIFVLTVAFASASFANYIETKDIDKGIFTVKYTDKSTTKYKVLVTKGKNKVSYPFFANGKEESFPLQFGNGDYTVGLMRHVEGKQYAFVEQKKIKLNMKDPNIVYLNSIQNVKWTEKDMPIKYAFNNAKDLKTAEAVFEYFYEYLVGKVTYDFTKAAEVKGDYVPSIVNTFVESRGICYDYSSLFAAFMRSQGIPTRLVKGYVPGVVEGYHAWNEILIDGKWMIVDTTVDAGTQDFEFKFKSSDDYKKATDY